MTLLFVGSVDCESPVSFRPPPPVGIEVEPRGGSNHIRLILRLVTRQRLQHSLSNSSLCRQPRAHRAPKRCSTHVRPVVGGSEPDMCRCLELTTAPSSRRVRDVKDCETLESQQRSNQGHPTVTTLSFTMDCEFQLDPWSRLDVRSTSVLAGSSCDTEPGGAGKEQLLLGSVSGRRC